ncbi:MAG: DNA-processing protein DprA [Chlamydiia bacterium]|nr:DNA-processing protein DprA [Chlamydiia bacterium]
MPTNLESLVILSHIPNLGPRRILSLIEQIGSPQEILKVSNDRIKKISSKLACSLNGWEKITAWKEDLKIVEKEGVRLLPYYDSLYPSSLFDLPDRPLILYIKGQVENLQEEMIGIIGTRAATVYGTELANAIGRVVAQSGYIVASGLARGIDTSAHKGALLMGKTMGIVGSGLANLYPQENKELAEKIGRKGVVISELPMFAPPTKYTFPRRNRLVAALCRALILVESPLKGGAMITMELGKKLNKPLFAFPGRVDDENFRGNHDLLKKGIARLIENANDLPFIDPRKEKINKISNIYSAEEQNLLILMKKEEKSIEELVLLTQLPVMKLNTLLTKLILKKTVKEFPGKRYKRMI